MNEDHDRNRFRLQAESAAVDMWVANTRVPAGGRPRLVIADDDPVVQSALSASLSREFDLVGVAADGEEAIEVVRDSRPHAALVDIAMPRGGGPRAVRGIVDAAPDTAIVLLSGQWSRLVNELIDAGAIGFRRKGIAPQALAEALIESIRIHTAERRESMWALLGWDSLGLNRASLDEWPRDEVRPGFPGPDITVSRGPRDG
jgi:CheY-like chemotaxis protein